MSDMTVANEIARQIGNEAFALMGTKRSELIGDDNSLMFRIRGSRAWNKIRVILTAMDTYTLHFYKIGKVVDVPLQETVSGVYFDQLHNVIEERTGLYLSLKPRNRWHDRKPSTRLKACSRLTPNIQGLLRSARGSSRRPGKLPETGGTNPTPSW